MPLSIYSKLLKKLKSAFNDCANTDCPLKSILAEISVQKKINYPDERKESEIMICPICGKVNFERGHANHIREVHKLSLEEADQYIPNRINSSLPLRVKSSFPEKPKSEEATSISPKINQEVNLDDIGKIIRDALNENFLPGLNLSFPMEFWASHFNDKCKDSMSVTINKEIACIIDQKFPEDLKSLFGIRRHHWKDYDGYYLDSSTIFINKWKIPLLRVAIIVSCFNEKRSDL